MFELISDPYKITHAQTSNIYGSNGVPPYDIGLSGIGVFIQTDTENGIYYPDVSVSSYIAVFWTKDKNNALARCSVKVQN